MIFKKIYILPDINESHINKKKKKISLLPKLFFFVLLALKKNYTIHKMRYETRAQEVEMKKNFHIIFSYSVNILLYKCVYYT